MMNQSAEPDAESAMRPPTTTESPQRPARARFGGAAAHAAWASATGRVSSLRAGAAVDSLGVAARALRSAQPTLPLPALLCGLALVYAQGAQIRWSIAIFLLLASLAAEAGLAALRFGRSPARDESALAWSPLHAGIEPPAPQEVTRLAAQGALAGRLGIALLVLAALCAAPVALVGAAPAALIVGLGVVAIAVFTFDRVGQVIAPLDGLIAALSLGPGLLALTVLAQGQRLTQPDWLVAAALGCVALAVVLGRSLVERDGEPDGAAPARRTLTRLLGARGVLALLGVALLAADALTLAVAMPRAGWPGALVALLTTPLAVLGVSGLAISHYAPARREAARQLAYVYTLFGVALAAGLALTLIVQGLIRTFVTLLGG